mgnify:FL=1
MGNLGTFNSSEHKDKAFDVMPAGDYDVIITDSNVKPTKKGTGHYLELKLQVISGQYQNRPLFARLNIDNPNPETVAIAKGQLSAICRAVNKLTINDSSELHMLPFKAVVRIGKDDSGNPTNEVKGFKPRHANGGEPTAPPTAPAGQTTQLMTQPSAPPAMTGGAPRSPFA